MKLPLNVIYEAVNSLIQIKSLKLGIKVDYWCNKNIKLFANDYNFYLEQITEVYSCYCYQGEDGQYATINENKIVFNLKPESDEKQFNKELNDLMTITCDEFEPYIMSKEVFDSLPNVNSSKFNLDLLAFLLPE